MSNKVKVSFGRIFWPSLVSGIVLLTLLIIFFTLLIGGLMGGKKPYSIKNNTVLHLTLSQEIGETTDARFDPGSFSMINKVGLSDLLYGFKRAANDDRIKGIFLELESSQMGYASATEIRNAINKFEESGKFVVAYYQGEVVTLKQFFIASSANESYGFPSSMFEFGGLGAELMYFKNMFDKLDLEMQVVRGSNNDFKSAVEPFFLEKMSDSSRVQISRYLNSIWNDITNAISQDKNVSEKDLNYYADNTSIRRVSDAVKLKLIDDVKYRDEVLEIIAEKVGESKVEDLKLEKFEKYAKNKFEANQKITRAKKSNIAVIIAEGGVVRKGEGLSSVKVVKMIKDARMNNNIKTVVLRVNSPGGSALASDEIWREVVLTKEVKPVIVSMGNVAASGGYYIAAPADKIFAESSTITGSIGVFGVIPYTGAMLENKLGLTFDRVGTNKRSVLSTNKKLTKDEYAIIQEEVDHIYTEFLDRVAKGRKLSKEQVDEIARGRVWTGKDAVKIGLVDEIGGITEAIVYAQNNVGLSDNEALVEYFPKVKKEPWMEILEAIDDQKEETGSIPSELIRYYKILTSIEQRTGIQARLPYDIEF